MLVLRSLRVESVRQQKLSRSLNTHKFDNGQGTAGPQRVDEPRVPPPCKSEDSLPRLAEPTATKADAPRMR